MKLEARRDHLQSLMSALSTMYKVIKGHHRATRTQAVPLVPLLRDTLPVSAAAESQVTSSTSTDCCLSAASLPPDAVEDLSLAADGKVAVAAAYERRREPMTRDGGCGGPMDVMLAAAHTTRNRVDISSSSLDRPPPAHSAKVDITACTYIVRNSCDAATDV